MAHAHAPSPHGGEDHPLSPIATLGRAGRRISPPRGMDAAMNGVSYRVHPTPASQPTVTRVGWIKSSLHVSPTSPGSPRACGTHHTPKPPLCTTKSRLLSPYWRPYWGAFQSQESPHAPGWAGLAVPSARLPSCVTLVASPIRHTTVARAPVRCGFRLLALARLKAPRGAGSPYRRAYSPPGSPRRVIERVTEEREARGYLGIQWPCSLRRGRASEPCTTDAPSLTHSSPRCPCCTGD
jgi:hypothetical protein